MSEKPIVVAVGIPTRDGIKMPTQRCLRALDLPRPFHVFDVEGKSVVEARNLITEAALRIPEVTHLLWIDDDMTFPPDAFRRLLAHDKPVVGGLCHNRRHPFMPILIYKQENASGYPYTYRYDYPQGLVEVDVTGAAFLLTRREVYEAMREARPKEKWFDQRGYGEDTSFCERVAEVGERVYVDTTLEIGHLTTVIVDSAFARRNRTAEANPWRPPAEVRAVEGAPVASIIIPTFNTPDRFLQQAIQSALDQTVPVEVIVVDDGSEVPVAFEDPPPNLRLLRHGKNMGCYPAINTGIAAMTTPYFCWLSADDWYAPNKVARQLRVMRARNARASFHGYYAALEGGEGDMVTILPPKWGVPQQMRAMLAEGCHVNGLTVMIERTLLEEARIAAGRTWGEWFPATEFPIVADWALWNEIGQRVFWEPIEEVLATRREHDNNDSRRFASNPKKRAQWVREDNTVRERFRPRCRNCGEVP